MANNHFSVIKPDVFFLNTFSEKELLQAESILKNSDLPVWYWEAEIEKIDSIAKRINTYPRFNAFLKMIEKAPRWQVKLFILACKHHYPNLEKLSNNAKSEAFREALMFVFYPHMIKESEKQKEFIEAQNKQDANKLMILSSLRTPCSSYNMGELIDWLIENGVLNESGGYDQSGYPLDKETFINVFLKEFVEFCKSANYNPITIFKANYLARYTYVATPDDIYDTEYFSAVIKENYSLPFSVFHLPEEKSNNIDSVCFYSFLFNRKPTF